MERDAYLFLNSLQEGQLTLQVLQLLLQCNRAEIALSTSWERLNIDNLCISVLWHYSFGFLLTKLKSLTRCSASMSLSFSRPQQLHCIWSSVHPSGPAMPLRPPKTGPVQTNAVVKLLMELQPRLATFIKHDHMLCSVSHPLASHLLGLPVELPQLGFIQLSEAWGSDMATLQGLSLSLQHLVLPPQCSHLQEGANKWTNLMDCCQYWNCTFLLIYFDFMFRDDINDSENNWKHLTSIHQCVCVCMGPLAFSIKAARRSLRTISCLSLVWVVMKTWFSAAVASRSSVGPSSIDIPKHSAPILTLL